MDAFPALMGPKASAAYQEAQAKNAHPLWELFSPAGIRDQSIKTRVVPCTFLESKGEKTVANPLPAPQVGDCFVGIPQPQ